MLNFPRLLYLLCTAGVCACDPVASGGVSTCGGTHLAQENPKGCGEGVLCPAAAAAAAAAVAFSVLLLLRCCLYSRTVNLFVRCVWLPLSTESLTTTLTQPRPSSEQAGPPCSRTPSKSFPCSTVLLLRFNTFE